ncbi:MAG: hypothetical protein M5U34_12390 [Chloroflexi bacterium]|nr:hypothetical protein [Chloroflexota bacterium]
MATTKPMMDKPRLASLDETIQEVSPRRMGRLGLLSGVLIGVAVALGLWGIQAISLRSLPLEQKYNSLVLAGGLIVVLCGFVGWVSGDCAKRPFLFSFWAATAFLATIIASYQNYQIRTVAAWLADSRFWGINIFPFTTTFNWLVIFWGVVLAGLFLMLLFAFLGLFQDSRLAAINQERNKNGRLDARAWLKLLLPLPLVILVGYLTTNIMAMANNSWRGIVVVDRVIQVVREYEGDLFTIGLDDGINYAAAGGVRDALAGEYTLSVGSIDPESLTTIIVADFASGSWIHCRFLNDQLNFCYDGSLPYTVGFTSLINGDPVPEDCRGCAVVADEQWANWLQTRRDQLGPTPQITRVGRQGDYVLMQAEAANGSLTVQCLFKGSSPVELMRCEEVD